jgi:hypothetical protein
MRRLEKIFGAELFSSQTLSQASFPSQSPSINGSLSTDISPRLQQAFQTNHSPAAAAATQEVIWMLDEDAPRCLSCDKRFFFPFRRRHHCRSCGLIFCSRCCSRFDLHANSSAVLTCFDCQRQLTSSVLERHSLSDSE